MSDKLTLNYTSSKCLLPTSIVCQTISANLLSLTVNMGNQSIRLISADFKLRYDRSFTRHQPANKDWYPDTDKPIRNHSAIAERLPSGVELMPLVVAMIGSAESLA